LRALPARDSKWLRLRICLTCGHVGCCDSLPNRHATAHHHATSHAIIRYFNGPGTIEDEGTSCSSSTVQEPEPASKDTQMSPPRPA
jgi:hypothetical protein